MRYIYPKLGKHEMIGIRIGGYGLGNLLFTYSRSLVLSKKLNMTMIWPTWPSIKLGPIIRREKDKRFYGDLFLNNSGYISGIRKYCILFFLKTLKAETQDEIMSAGTKSVVIFENYTMNFEDIIDYRELIYNDIIRNLKEKNKMPLKIDFSKCINVHVRLGDFSRPDSSKLASGINNMQLPINWYVSVINRINKVTDNKLTFNIFSDGTNEQLEKILNLNNTRRAFYGSSIADILAMSRSPVLIASGSSTSLWARFLGNSSSISYPNQKKCSTLTSKGGFEIELSSSGEIDMETVRKIKGIYGID